jgi:Domain of unknown function (DUF5658)
VGEPREAKMATESRDVADRRAFGWRTVIFGFLRSRRREHRRSAEDEPVFIDWHHPWLFFLAVGTMLLSCLDAFFTLRLLDRGAIEVNPVMAVAISYGTLAFTVSKMLMTGLGILMLVFLSRSRLFNRVRTGLFLTVFFSVYACVVCYQFVLLLQPA